MKKTRYMACMLMIMSLCMPIQTFASSTELKEIPDLTIIEDDKFSKLVEQILSIKQQHPEWSIQQIKEFVDESCRIEENSRGNIADIWSVLTDSEKKLVIPLFNYDGEPSVSNGIMYQLPSFHLFIH